MKKSLLIVVLVLVAGGGYMLLRSTKAEPMNEESQVVPKEVVKETAAVPAGPVKEFATTAYYDATGVWFSLKEMRVAKGDTVRVKATNTKGMHDFTIDEFGIHKELPINEEVVIEFVADKTGEFIYYCSMPGHRAKGQWGKLIVE